MCLTCTFNINIFFYFTHTLFFCQTQTLLYHLYIIFQNFFVKRNVYAKEANKNIIAL